jgi:hypothetical protein
MPQAPSKRPLGYLTHLINHCIRLLRFPKSGKEANVITLQKSVRTSPKTLRPVSLLSTTGKLFGKVKLKIVQSHTEERRLRNASQFGFRAHHSIILQSMRPMDHVAPNNNSNTFTAAVCLDIGKDLDNTWHNGLLYKLSKLEFSAGLIKFISSFILRREFRVSVR